MSDIRKLYLSNFLIGTSVMSSVTLTLFLLSNNISQSQISILFAVMMFTTAFFQIPTGGFADKFGCKKSVFIGIIIHAFSFIILFFAHSFNDFLAAMILVGLGISLQSGAFSSLIHRILSEKKRPEDYSKIWGRSYAFFDLAVFIISPIGAFIYQYYPRLPFLLSFLTVLTASLIIFLVKSKDGHSRSAPQKSFFSIIKVGTLYTLFHPKLIAISIVGSALMTASMLMNQNISQPYQISIGNDVTGIGFTASFVALTIGVVFYFSHHFISKVNVIVSMMFITMATVFCLIALGMNYILPIGIFFILTYYGIQAFREPFLNTLIQKEAKNEQRSTIVSTMVFINSLIIAIALPFWGMSIENFGLRTTLIYLSLFVLTAGTLGTVIYSLGLRKGFRAIISPYGSPITGTKGIS